MSSDKNNYQTKLKLGDYPCSCDICGNWTWFSEGKIQHKYTGKGGTFACKNCVDDIHYGLVPYKIKPEKPVPLVRNAQSSVTTAQSINFNTSPPTVEE